jgi:glycosyltransferase involved in cell wall biosynthesis
MVLIGDIRYDGRVRKEIGTLSNAGHQVELIVSDFTKHGVGGEDLGIKIHYIPMTLWSSPIRNFLEQLLFNSKAASIIKDVHPNYIHCHDLLSLLSGVWAKRDFKVNLVFDAHELMPEMMGGIRGFVWNYIERKYINYCDYTIFPEKNRIAFFQEKYSKIPKPLLLENFPRKQDIPTAKIDLLRNIYPIKNDQKIILYTGFINSGRYIEELIDSISICSKEFVLIIIGISFKDYEASLRKKIKGLHLEDRVFLHGAAPYAEILQYMASCDIGTAFYRNTDVNNYYCAPNKLYEYIALDKAVLTNNYPGLLQNIEYFRQGVCLEEVTPENLVKAYYHAIDSTLITPGSRKFFWDDQEYILVQLYAR